MPHTFSDVTIEELKPQRVVSYRAVSSEPEDDSVRMVQNWLVQHGLSVESQRSFGFDVAVSPAEAAQGKRAYEIGYTVPPEVQPDDGVQERYYGGGTYAVMRIYNAFEAPFESIPAGWMHLMEWIKDNPDWKGTYNLCYEELVPGENGNDLILYHHVEPRK
jgi:DNA gyrase inhibitor GyrI